jgi:hypothetical protein
MEAVILYIMSALCVCWECGYHKALDLNKEQSTPSVI